MVELPHSGFEVLFEEDGRIAAVGRDDICQALPMVSAFTESDSEICPLHLNIMRYVFPLSMDGM